MLIILRLSRAWPAGKHVCEPGNKIRNKLTAGFRDITAWINTMARRKKRRCRTDLGKAVRVLTLVAAVELASTAYPVRSLKSIVVQVGTSTGFTQFDADPVPKRGLMAVVKHFMQRWGYYHLDSHRILLGEFPTLQHEHQSASSMRQNSHRRVNFGAANSPRCRIRVWR